jgi:hypothetical protein
MRSKFAAIGAMLYLIAFACASDYPLFDHSTFAGLAAVLLALPWIVSTERMALGRDRAQCAHYLFPVGGPVVAVSLVSTIDLTGRHRSRKRTNRDAVRCGMNH